MPCYLDYLRKLLTERLDALSQEASKTVTDMTEEGENPGDLMDQATVEADWEDPGSLGEK